MKGSKLFVVMAISVLALTAVFGCGPRGQSESGQGGIVHRFEFTSESKTVRLTPAEYAAARSKLYKQIPLGEEVQSLSYCSKYRAQPATEQMVDVVLKAAQKEVGTTYELLNVNLYLFHRIKGDVWEATLVAGYFADPEISEYVSMPINIADVQALTRSTLPNLAAKMKDPPSDSPKEAANYWQPIDGAQVELVGVEKGRCDDGTPRINLTWKLKRLGGMLDTETAWRSQS